MSQIQGYFDQIRLRLVESEIVEGFQVRKERITTTDGFIRIRGELTNGGVIEFSEYSKFHKKVVTEEYTFQWQSSKGRLIRRWDNANHHPEIESSPHHVHVDEESNVFPSEFYPQQTLGLLEKLEQLYSGGKSEE